MVGPHAEGRPDSEGRGRGQVVAHGALGAARGRDEGVGECGRVVEATFTTVYKRPVVRLGPQTAKHGASASRALGDALGRAGRSDIMNRAADYVVPYGGTHALLVPIV